MIAFAFTFPAGRYHATPWGRHANEADVAWPPEPARILRALIAIWWRKADHGSFAATTFESLIDALATDPPVFRLPEAVHAHTRAYMPAPVERKLIYDAFLRLDRNAELIAAWPRLTATGEQQSLAAHLLERIGYLGRAESWAEGHIALDWNGEVNVRPRSAEATPDAHSVPVDLAVPLTPAAWSELRARVLPTLKDMGKAKRTIIESTLPERLSEALAVDTGRWQEAGWSSPPPIRKILYDRPPVGPLPLRRKRTVSICSGQPAVPEAARFVLAGHPCPRIEESVRIGEIARWALMSGGGIPPVELSGRNENGPLRDDPAHCHAFYLSEDADGDGRIDHVIVYCRRGFSDEARRRLDGLTRLWIEHGHASDEGERGRKEWRVALEGILRPEEFASASRLLKQSCVWHSATPYLKSRFDKRQPRTFEAVLESYRSQITAEWGRRFSGLPPPTIRVLTDPTRPSRFAAPLGPGGALRSTLAFIRTRGGHGGRQPDTAGGFFQLTFPQPIGGPIALGWGCHFGLGVFRSAN